MDDEFRVRNVYVIESPKNSFKFLVIDERVRGGKKLPTRRGISKEEYVAKVCEVCSDIHDLKYVKSLPWSAIADVYSTTASVVRNFYVRFCRGRKLSC